MDEPTNMSSQFLEMVLATSNKGKLKEFNDLMSALPVKIFPQSEFNVDDAEEIGLTFVENAIIKARHAAKETQMPALADDSGLVVDALAGKPGIYSARYAGENATATDNIKKLLTDIAHVPAGERTARFICILVLFRYPQDPTPLICEASWEGEILLSPQGQNGFGYDPLFWVPTHQCSAAELDSVTKNKLSHRANAFKLFRERFSEQFSEVKTEQSL